MNRFALFAGVLVAACSGQEARPLPAAPDTPAASGTPAPAATPATPAPSAPAAGVAAPGPPPNGTWNFTREEKVNTCVKADAGALGGLGKQKPVPQPILVPLHHPKDGATIASFVFQPSPWLGLRHDVPMEVGKVAVHGSKPDKSCGYEVRRETEVTEATGDRMVLQVRTTYGDPKGCASAITPASCKVDLVLTYTLVQKLCDARCEMTGAKVTLIGGMDASGATCVCLDGGVPQP